jgi:hypothetical protein
MLFYHFQVQGQDPVIIKSPPLLQIAADRPGDFYTIDNQKKIKKYNPKGEIMAESTLQKIPTLFDPWSGVRLFTYYAATREIQYLDPTLSLLSILLIDSAFAIEPFLACPSGEYNYWLLDKADLSLKKIHLRENKVQTEVVIGDALTSPEDVLHMREYLNYVFVLDQKKGIIIFNQLGIKVKEFPVKTKSFGFYGEELYYVENNTLVFYDLYSGELKKMSLTEPTIALILLQNKLISFRNKEIKIIDFTR